MNRSVFKNLSHYTGVTYGSVVPCSDKEFVYSDSELNRVLSEIFSVDELTGFPRGDIAYFLSKDGNPQVKAWLESNLLVPRAKQSGSSIEGVTDDFIAEFARNDGESVSDYSIRLRGYYDSAQAELAKLTSSKSE